MQAVGRGIEPAIQRRRPFTQSLGQRLGIGAVVD